MNRVVFFFAIGLIICSTGLVDAFPDTAKSSNSEKIHHALSTVSVPFIENEGQTAPEVAYYAKTFGATLFVNTKGELFYEFPTFSLTEHISGLNPALKGSAPSRTNITSFIGNDRSKWKKSLGTYNAVLLGKTSSGAEITLNAYGKKIEKVITIPPYASPTVTMSLAGASSLGLGPKGELIVETDGEIVSFSKPEAYQEINGSRVPVIVAYMFTSSPLSYTFAVGSYDQSYPLTIDPVLQTTYLGGNNVEYVHNIAIGDQGIYVSGLTYSSDFPGTPGGARPSFGGGLYDAFVALLSPDLTTLTQATYFGGGGYDYGWALAVGVDSVYLAGETYSADLPGTTGGAQPMFKGGSDRGSNDAFVALFSPDLTILTQATYLGGTDYEWAGAITINDQGIYVTGRTFSPDFLCHVGGAQPSLGGASDVFVTLLSSDLKSAIQSTYLGGSADDYTYATTLGANGIYVAGYTESPDFPGTSDAAQQISGGYVDAFVSLLSFDLKTLTQSTYLGGRYNDSARALAFGFNGVYVGGTTESPDLPNSVSGAQQTYGGNGDAFVSLLAPDLKTLTQSTYLGGSGSDYVYSLALSADGIYVAGYTTSADFSGMTGGAQQTYGGNGDAFVSLLAPDLKTLTQSTYLGGSGSDYVYSLALSADGIYVAGGTESSDLPNSAGGIQTILKGNGDAFITRLSHDLSEYFQLTITKTGTGIGTVSGQGISCGMDCTEAISHGTPVTLTANPDAGSTFSSWSGCDLPDGDTCTVSMSADKSVNTIFTVNQYTLTATTAGTGSGSLTDDGLSCMGNTCTGTYNYGDTVHITATPSSDSVFGGWTGCDSTTETICTVEVSGDRNITATFNPKYTLVVNTEGTGEGRVTSEPVGIDCEPTCTGFFGASTNIRLNVRPYAGSAFAYWSGGCSGTTDSCEFGITGNTEIKAHFTSAETKQYKLKVKKAKKNGGVGSVASNDGNIVCGDICFSTYYKDTVVSFTALAFEGSTFIGWKPDLLNCIGTGPCTVTVDKAKSVKAVFVGDYKLKVVNKSKYGGTGTITSTPSGINCVTGNTIGCEGIYGYGKTVTLSASANPGFTFRGWAPATLCPGIGDCTVPMDKKRTITAIFTGSE